MLSHESEHKDRSAYRSYPHRKAAQRRAATSLNPGLIPPSHDLVDGVRQGSKTAVDETLRVAANEAVYLQRFGKLPNATLKEDGVWEGMRAGLRYLDHTPEANDDEFRRKVRNGVDAFATADLRRRQWETAEHESPQSGPEDENGSQAHVFRLPSKLRGQVTLAVLAVYEAAMGVLLVARAAKHAVCLAVEHICDGVASHADHQLAANTERRAEAQRALVHAMHQVCVEATQDRTIPRSHVLECLHHFLNRLRHAEAACSLDTFFDFIHQLRNEDH
ncbi:MAG: hypothetical protein IT349_09185 [Candidatus Eisenbacteria bacterium]|nr:hypothetical protein [Candidatus Eisenbacteria bacterium]